ncbi:hypothetical protein KIMH_14580 [Bombiscardovia apis]|uniref:Uncharacterized protein n=1 Tax=Bombiscardovia apis TaxID=2932182 RepID=A0ABM8BEW1_9BIFI|nr:hypothetical protein KIMH_14580 [Bombiscardovia apis]
MVHRGGGDPAGVAQRVAGAAAQVSLNRSNQAVTVSVSCPVISGPLGVLPARVSGSAVGMLNE